MNTRFEEIFQLKVDLIKELLERAESKHKLVTIDADIEDEEYQHLVNLAKQYNTTIEIIVNVMLTDVIFQTKFVPEHSKGEAVPIHYAEMIVLAEHDDFNEETVYCVYNPVEPDNSFYWVPVEHPIAKLVLNKKLKELDETWNEA